MITLLFLLAGLQVHEWGVITQNPVSLSGAIPVVEPWELELEAKAPVIYFHGDPCTVSVRISFPENGYATEVLPIPTEGGVNSDCIIWENLSLTNSPETPVGKWPGCSRLAFPSHLWRDVDALTVTSHKSSDRFIYYECSPGDPEELPFMSTSDNHSIKLPYGEIPCIVLKSVSERPMYGIFTMADIINDVPEKLHHLKDTQVLYDELWAWADGLLFEDEFNSFWNTWESRFLSDASSGTIVIYLVPEDIIRHIASIEIIPDSPMEVEINRFIIAELPYIPGL